MTLRRLSSVVIALILGVSIRSFVVAQTAQQTAPPPPPPATAPQTPAKTPAAPPRISPIPAAAASPTTGWTEPVLTAPIVGQVWAYVPKHPVTPNVFLFISGDGGWYLGVVDMARRIMPKAIVIGISYNGLRKAPLENGTCWTPETQLTTVAKSVEEQLHLPEYRPPILLGYSSGATMVYQALAVAAHGFAGGLSLGFCPDMPSNHNVCAIEGFKPTPYDPKRGQVILPKVPKLEREWYVINGIEDVICKPDAMHEFLDDMGNAHARLDIPNTGHGFTKPGNWGPTFDEDVQKLLDGASSIGKKRY